jgi:Trk K+ transport system NAD-binding subunit
VTLDLVMRAREANPDARIIAEVADPANNARVKKAGANNVMAPMPNLPNIMARTILAPGIESVVLDLCDSGAEEVVRYNVATGGLWGEMQCKLILAGAGTPVSFEDKNGDVASHAKATQRVETNAIFMVVPKGQIKTDEEIRAILDRPLPAAAQPTADRPAA